MFKLTEEKPEVFEFEFEGETYSVPAVSSLPMQRFRAIRKALSESSNPEEAMFDEIMALFDEYIPDVMQRVTMGQASRLFREYARSGGGVTLGES